MPTRNPPEMQDSPDIINLIYTDEDDVIENLRLRHANKQVYTGVSHITLAMNPYARYPIYGKDKIQQSYDNVRAGTATDTPSVYNVSVRAYIDMCAHQRNNSVVVSGESGAGKTENAKRLMEALTAYSTLPGLEMKILFANPIMETFGNAKTVMNNNSSRFGKFTKMLFEPEGAESKLGLTGARISTYLLEKSRITMQGINERNYHAFYTCFTAQQKGKGDFKLTKPKDYHFLYGNGPDGPVQAVEVAARNEDQEFAELEEAWKELEFAKDAPNEIYGATASVLHLGQLHFEVSGDGFGVIGKKDTANVANAARFMSVGVPALKERLHKRSIKVGGSTIMADLNLDDAIANRDALAKAVFHRLFLYVVGMTGDALAGKETADGKFIGILDIFGFERFEVNSLEQLCINYCNEALQQFFNESVVVSEQEEYLREGLPWSELSVPDNKDMVTLITHKKKGIFFLTDSTCQMPKGTPDHLYDALMRSCAKNPKFSKKNPEKKKSKKKRDTKSFTVIHYAAIVEYDVGGFLVKNRDSLHVDTINLLDGSKNKVVKAMMQNDVKAMKKKTKSFQGIGTSFIKSLHELMKVLESTKAWFLRCLNPNQTKSTTDWADAHVRRQLRCNGIIECIKVIKLGYPSRTPHDFVINKFKDCLTAAMGDSFTKLTKRKMIQSILYGMGVPPDEYELGFTKVFFKPNPKPIMADIQNHSGKFEAEQIEVIKKQIAASLGKELTGLLKAYFRLGKSILAKLVREEAKTKVAQMLWVVKFVSMVRVEREKWREEQGMEELPEVELPDSSGYEDSSTGYDDSSTGYDTAPAAGSPEQKRANTLRKLDMLAASWSVNSVMGEAFMKYGRRGFPHERLIQIDIEGLNLMWNNGQLPIGNILDVKAGITTEVLQRHSSKLDENLCFSIIFEDRTFDLRAVRKGQRNVWVAALRLLAGKGKPSQWFRKMRRDQLNKTFSTTGGEM